MYVIGEVLSYLKARGWRRERVRGRHSFSKGCKQSFKKTEPSSLLMKWGSSLMKCDTKFTSIVTAIPISTLGSQQPRHIYSLIKYCDISIKSLN